MFLFAQSLQQVSHDLTHLMKATGEGKEKRESYDAYAQCACEVCRHSCRAWTQEELDSVPECLTGTGCKYELAIIGPTLIWQCRTHASVKPVSPTVETSKCTHVQLDSSIQSLQKADLLLLKNPELQGHVQGYCNIPACIYFITVNGTLLSKLEV